ncbi:cupin domain-containing protein [Rhizorhabdus sp. FW153]|uniref:cupin domain-containing protein n=1 Tax=Rhizorhabdus sp. FW153 TaxID=3400216 RepID=UPI003CE75EF5
MEIVRLADAKAYIAPLHYDMRSLRLQGCEASSADFAWAGLSYFLPGGGAEMDAGPLGKIYIVIDGEITIELGSGVTQILGKLDSCFIPAGEARAVRNDGQAIATMIVVMPYLEKSA